MTVCRPLVALLALFALAGCTAQAEELRTYELDDDALSESSTDPDGRWQSAPWSGGSWLPFSGGSTLKVAHPLGRAPTVVLVYLSFTEDDGAAQATRSAFLGAGDVANVFDVGSKHVSIKNRSNADFFARLVLE